ncbi:hypothetical protein D3C81_2009470 [compost metagenome]
MLVSQIFRPDAITAWRQYAFGVNGVFERLVEAQQGVITKRLGTHHIILEGWSRSILSPSVSRGQFDEMPKYLPAFLILGRIFADEQRNDEGKATFPRRNWDDHREDQGNAEPSSLTT